MTVTQNRQASAQIAWDGWNLTLVIIDRYSKVLLLLKMKLLRLKAVKSLKKIPSIDADLPSEKNPTP